MKKSFKRSVLGMFMGTNGDNGLFYIKRFAKFLRNFILSFSFYCKSKGKNNKVYRNWSCKLTNVKIVFRGNGNTVFFGDDCDICGLRILIVGDNNRINFGKNVTINASWLKPTVINAIGGKTIDIGDNCLFSNNIEVHTSDYHGIYDSSGVRINPDKGIVIGNNVWIGLGTKILKGTKIADGCIVGCGSVLTGAYKDTNGIICGNPAKYKKNNIFWDYGLGEKCEVRFNLKE